MTDTPPPAVDPPPQAGATPLSNEEIKAKAADVLKDVKSGFETAKTKREPYGLFAFASAVAALIWLCWFSDNRPAFWNLGLWTVFVLAAISLLFAPMVRGTLNISEARAHQLATAGAGGMVFAWIAFLLPNIETNRAFFGTLATAFAGLAAWMAPGRPSPKGEGE
jgi:hypothetical protein